MGIVHKKYRSAYHVHGDDDGLVIPPHLAPVECRVIPIAQHKEGVLEKANELLDELKKPDTE